MKVLVTGHRGYVGCHLLPELARRGHEVVAVDAGWFEGCDFGPPPLQPSRTVSADIRDLDATLFEGIDAVIHLAAFSNDPLGSFNPDLTARVNHIAAVSLARLARDAGVARFLFASSCSVYGAGDDALLEESAPINPLTPYAVAKAAAERDIAQLAGETFSPVFLRPGTAYGSSSRLRGDLVINNLLAHALFDGEVLMKSDGRPWRPIVHVEDVARVFGALLDAPRDAVHGATFNVGFGGDNYRVADLARAVADAVPGSVLRFAAGAAADARSYRVSCRRLAEALPAFKPRWTLPRGIADLAARFVEFGVRRESFFGSRFFRLERIREGLDAGALDRDLRWRSDALRSRIA